MNTPGYKKVDPKAAFEDVKKRRDDYLAIYETVDERDGSFIKIINNQTFIVHNARGYLPQKVRLDNVTYIVSFRFVTLMQSCGLCVASYY